MTIALLILGLLLFVGLVVVHEYGHFIAARRSDVEVEEFGIGFPPRAWGKKMKSGFLLSLNWLPLGGFVRLKGEHDADTSKGSFGAASLRAKIKIMMAGVAMNLLVAFIMLTVLAWVGVPKLIENQFTIPSDTTVSRNEVLVGYVESGSPADNAGLTIRDRLVSMQYGSKSTDINNANDLPNITKQAAGQDIILNIKRDGVEKSLKTKLRSSDEIQASQNTADPKGYLGIAPTEFTLQRSSWSAPIVAAGLIKQITIMTFQGIGNALGSLLAGEAGKASAQVSGPVGIFVLLKDGSLLGFQFVLMIIAIISLTLAIMNALPIPALDGGRLFVTLLFRTLRKPLSQQTEDRIHGTGFAVLMALFVVITIVDIRRFG